VYGHCLVSLRPGHGLDDGCARLCAFCLWHAPPASQALVALDALALSPELTQSTLGVLLKYQDDIAKFSRQDIEQRVLSAQTAAE
jgi:hypothetical protein